MPRISEKARHFYTLHGCSESDIDYIATNADSVEETDNWVMAVATAPDGVIWLYPTSPGNIFPNSLWKRIRWYVLNNDNVVIPMSENMEKVRVLAQRYNGYLVDNYYLFGDELKGIQQIESGGTLWHH